MSEPIAAGIIIALLRMVAFVISGLLAYFGYRLFFTVPHQTESGGKIETPGLTITLSRIAPGTFFAICAAGIVIASFLYPMRIEGLYGGAIGATDQVKFRQEREKFADEMQKTTLINQSTLEANAAHLRTATHQMACIRQKYNYTEDESNAIDQARVALMTRLWQPKWGDFQTFEAWALEGRGDPPITFVKHLYTEKDPRCKY